jgi:uncharacterized membrane protein
MIAALLTCLLWFSAIGSGIIAGLFFAFSTFIMTALAKIPQAHGISAMQSINTTILGSLFMPVFLGTTLAGLVLAVIGIVRWGEPGAPAMAAGGIIYVVGMFVCTIALNVPLNNALAAVDPGSAQGAQIWARYLADWTMWNHVRTVASVVACGLFILSITAR